MTKKLARFLMKLEMLRSVRPLTFASLLFNPTSSLLHLGIVPLIKH